MTASKKAFSLLEATVILGIIGVVTGGIWVVLANARDNQRATALTQDTISLVQNIREYYTMQALPSAAPDVTTALRNAGVFPESMCSQTCMQAALPRFVMPYEIGSSAITVTASSNYINIRYGLGSGFIPKDGCIKILTSINRSYQQLGAAGYVVTTALGSDAKSFPRTPAEITASCNWINNTNTVGLMLAFSTRN